eukprot:TRINITY_DN24009_c1_g4_i4.p1 TRINITY_DN24009_c1_g4~~TRINITY_DN24009_c1_g4_i4.p1  ORF type:complete len:1837 (+),score=555.65 TRINITY_DN24009_c1_g4_i4:463-5511(+)
MVLSPAGSPLIGARSSRSRHESGDKVAAASPSGRSDASLTASLDLDKISAERKAMLSLQRERAAAEVRLMAQEIAARDGVPEVGEAALDLQSCVENTANRISQLKAKLAHQRKEAEEAILESRTEAELMLQASESRVRELQMQLAQQRGKAAAEAKDYEARIRLLEAQIEDLRLAGQEQLRLARASADDGLREFRRSSENRSEVAEMRNKELEAQLSRERARLDEEVTRSAARIAELEARLEHSQRLTDDAVAAAKRDAAERFRAADAKYQELADSLRYHRESSAVEGERVAELESRLAKQEAAADEALSRAKAEYARRQREAEARFEEQLAQMRRQLDELQTETDNAQARSAELEVLMENRQRAHANELTQAKAEAQRRMLSSDGRCQQVEDELRQLQRQYDALQQEADQARAHAAEIEALADSRQRAHAQELSQARAESQKRAQTNDARCRDFEEQVTQLRRQLESLQQDTDQAQARSAELEALMQNRQRAHANELNQVKLDAQKRHQANESLCRDLQDQLQRQQLHGAAEAQAAVERAAELEALLTSQRRTSEAAETKHREHLRQVQLKHEAALSEREKLAEDVLQQARLKWEKKLQAAELALEEARGDHRRQLQEASAQHEAAQRHVRQQVEQLSSHVEASESRSAERERSAQAERDRLAQESAAKQAELQELLRRAREDAGNREAKLGARLTELEAVRKALEREVEQTREEGDLHLRAAEASHSKLQDELRHQCNKAAAEANAAASRVTDLEATLDRHQRAIADSENNAKSDAMAAAARIAILEERLRDHGAVADEASRKAERVEAENLNLRSQLAKQRELAASEANAAAAELGKLQGRLDAQEMSARNAVSRALAANEEKAEASQLREREAQLQLAQQRGVAAAEAKVAMERVAALEAKIVTLQQEADESVSNALEQSRRQKEALEQRNRELQTALAQQRGSSLGEIKAAAERISQLEVQLERQKLGIDAEPAKPSPDLEMRLQASEARVKELHSQLAQQRGVLAAETKSSASRIAELEVALEEERNRKHNKDAPQLAASQARCRELEAQLQARHHNASADMQDAQRRLNMLQIELESERKLRQAERVDGEKHIDEADALAKKFQVQLERQQQETRAELRAVSARADQLQALLAAERRIGDKAGSSEERPRSSSAVQRETSPHVERERRASQAQERWSSARITELEVQLAKLEAANANSTAARNDVEKRLRASEARCTELSAELESVRKDAAADAGTSESRIEQLESQLAASNAEVEELRKKKAELEVNASRNPAAAKRAEKAEMMVKDLEAKLSRAKSESEARLATAEVRVRELQDALDEEHEAHLAEGSRACDLELQLTRERAAASEALARSHGSGQEQAKSRELARQLALLQDAVATEAQATERVSELAADLAQQRELLRAAGAESEERLLASESMNETLIDRLRELQSRVESFEAEAGAALAQARAARTDVAVQAGDAEDPRDMATRGVRIGGGYHIFRTPIKSEASAVHAHAAELKDCIADTLRASLPAPGAPTDYVAHPYAHGAPARASSAERFRVGAQLGDRCYSQQSLPRATKAHQKGAHDGAIDDVQLYRVLTSKLQHSKSATQTVGTEGPNGPGQRFRSRPTSAGPGRTRTAGDHHLHAHEQQHRQHFHHAVPQSKPRVLGPDVHNSSAPLLMSPTREEPEPPEPM